MDMVMPSPIQVIALQNTSPAMLCLPFIHKGNSGIINLPDPAQTQQQKYQNRHPEPLAVSYEIYYLRHNLLIRSHCNRYQSRLNTGESFLAFCVRSMLNGKSISMPIHMPNKGVTRP